MTNGHKYFGLKRVHNIYTTDKTFTYEVPEYEVYKTFKVFSNKEGKVLSELTRDGFLNVYEGYSSDGCTPKYILTLFGKRFVIGTSDGDMGYDGLPLLYHAALKHDALTQMYDIKDFPYTRKQLAHEFKEDMKRVKWFWRGLYYTAVRVYDILKGYK